MMTIHVTMLGQFSITIGDNRIADMTNLTKKPWSILEYLITFRNREISSDELMELIWAKDESINPSGALKTLLFRSRQLLAPLGVSPQELIIQSKGCYAWSSKVETIVDSDIFESLCGEAETEKTDDKRLELYLKAIDLYKGDFLGKSAWEPWIAPINSKYHTLYLQIVQKAIQLLGADDDWAKITEICRKAIEIEPFNEEFHYQMIYALYRSGNQQKALEHYNKTTNAFYREFAITPSARLKSLYKIIRDEKHGVVTDLSFIQDDLQEGTDTRGAFLCEYSVFKDIYQLERRAISRTGDSVYLCLFTLSDGQGDLLKPAVLARAMNGLEETISISLRSKDAFTRYSISQYLILLSTASFENADMVINRITSNFKKAYSRKDMNILSSLLAVLPE